MKNVDYMHVAEDSINKIKEGAFLTVKHSVINNCVFNGFMVKRFHEATNYL